MNGTEVNPRYSESALKEKAFLQELDFVRLIFSIFFHIKYYSPCLFGLKICIIYIYLNY